MGAARVWKPPAFDIRYAPPVDGRGVRMLFIAGDNAAFAPNAAAHVEMEAVLLAPQRSTRGHQYDAIGVRSCE
jgi:hypothetical protein